MSILTNYRPNFCCECGAKIVRLRWFVWTSRSFCDKCFRALARTHWLRPSVTLIALIVFSVLLGRGCRRAPPPLIVERPVTSATHNAGVTTPASTSAGSQPEHGAQPTATDQLYTCGARTKKGTPCSRRVHGPVRCWQHKGERAMLPQEKLVVKE